MKRNEGFLNGPKCFFEMVKSYELTLNSEEQKVVEPILSNNNFFGNSENVLMSMLYDPSKLVRKRAVARSTDSS